MCVPPLRGTRNAHAPRGDHTVVTVALQVVLLRLKVLRYQKKSERLESELKEARMVRGWLAVDWWTLC